MSNSSKDRKDREETSRTSSKHDNKFQERKMDKTTPRDDANRDQERPKKGSRPNSNRDRSSSDEDGREVKRTDNTSTRHSKSNSKRKSDHHIEERPEVGDDSEDGNRNGRKSGDYKRYWGQDDSEKRDSRRSRYQNEHQGRKREQPIGSRYYGEYSKDESRGYKGSQRDLKPQNNDGDGTDNDRRKRSDENQATIPSVAKPQRKAVDMLTTKTGGAYIPPARLRMMQAQITDKSSAAYQRLSWEALKKSIHGHINKVNTGNIGIIVRELLRENVVRGRGLLCRSIIQAQAASITFTHVYAALVAVVNSKFPRIGELLLRRLIIQFKRGFKRNDKSICISAATFVAHLVNQCVAHEILALEILTLLVESPTDDSIEVAIAFLKECGAKLLEVSSKGIHAIFEMLRNILHEGQLETRVQYMIEVMFQVRKENFVNNKAISEDLELVDETDQFTHLLTLEDVTDAEDLLNVFKLDPDFEENEKKYVTIKEEILGKDDSDSSSGDDDDEEDDDDDDEEEKAKEDTIIDNTETNLVALRRTIYLTIHSSLDFEECAHKLMRMQLKPGQEIELCHMFLDCCAEQRTYEKFYGLLSQRFCQINKIFIPPFQQIFKDTYDTIHRLDTNKLRNVAKFFAHLLFTDAISWEVLSFIRLNEEETTSSSRIFIKILFQELSEYMGLTKLNERVKDVTLQAAFDGLFPRDDPKNTRFAINFFTSIGLGGLTDELRDHLKSQSKILSAPKVVEAPPTASKVSSSSSSSDSSSSSSSSESSSSSDSEEESRKSKKSKKTKHSREKKKSVQQKKSQRTKRKSSPPQSKHSSKRRKH